MKNLVDIIIPVYDEGKNILSTIETLFEHISFKFKIVICYDYEADNTLTVIKNSKFSDCNNIYFLKNFDRGPHSAVMTGILNSDSDYVIVLPADDDYNAPIIELMINQALKNNLDIVCPSRFINGLSMQGASLIKKILVISANFLLKNFASMPVHDSTNGFRLFSKKIIKNIKIESSFGFTYSIEYLVKGHRYGYKIAEIPAIWKERKFGKSRFKIFKWIFPYLRWFVYAFFTKIKKK